MPLTYAESKKTFSYNNTNWECYWETKNATAGNATGRQRMLLPYCATAPLMSTKTFSYNNINWECY